MTSAKILIVEDDSTGAAHLEACLKNLGYTVCAAASCGREAVEIAGDARPDLALVDLGLGGEATGPEVAEHLDSRFDVPVVYLTDEVEGDLLKRAQATHPFGYVVRPIEERQLHLNIQTAVSMHERESGHGETKTRLKRIINKYKDLNRLMKTVFDSMSEGVFVFRDITRLKRAEAELERAIATHRSQAQFMETVFNSMDEGVVAVDENGQILFFNSSTRRIGGDLPEERDIGKWAERYGVFLPDGKTLFPFDKSPLDSALKGEATDEVEALVLNDFKPEGVHIRINSRPLLRERGVSKGAVLVFRDVTGLKRAEAELERTKARSQDQARLMETIFNSISDGIVVADAAGKFLYANPAAEQIVGIGTTAGTLDEWAETYGAYHPDRETPMKTEDLPLMRAIHRGESTDEEDVFIRNEKKPNGVYIRMSGRPLLDNIGGIRGGVVIFRDVTERVLAEETLARAFDQGRLEMVDTILHNIGNAINSVTTGIETVRRHLVDDRVGRRLSALADAIRAHRNDWIDYIANDPQGQKVMPFVVEIAEDFGRRNDELMKTVGRVRDRANRIADIIRTQKTIDSASMDRKDIELYDALSGAFRVLRDSLNKRGIHTDVDCKNAPQEIRVRESQFHQMLINLVKNSIEAIDELAAAEGLQETPRIGIRASAEDGFLNLEISDNGIGIKHKDTRVLFAPGYTTKESGSGLGLHSAANFVIASGGRIQPLSEGTGRGTIMRVMLPLSAVAPQATAGKRRPRVLPDFRD